MHGAAGVVTYAVSQCLAASNASGNCHGVGVIATDAAGSGTSAFVMQNTDPSIFVLTRGTQAEFATGFVVQ